ncbi:haloacid dehalogenase type II [Hyphomicrobiales bacterium FT118]|uniref:(S)-2-haloacid dehalogenase n=2 Tax=Futiania mangrovi TaxID=2959716 RepID=A0A9J6PC55_9PROT|nr:haloacid dehalogenase type II [Futiania mangrovii]MCP1336121.1 haloacid dehalogenase type II [Futiania mangrovii]
MTDTGPDTRFARTRVAVFDAYGTLFDVAAAARHLADEIGPQWQTLSAVWREKQLQYTWLRAVMNRHTDFWSVTRDGLDYALETADLGGDAGLRQRLLDLYWQLDAYPEVPEVLRALKRKGIATAILSNGSPDMLAAAVESAGIGPLLDDVISVEDAGVFKPDFSVYRLASDRMAAFPPDIAFFSSNGWDAAGAAAFGFAVCWVNRAGAPQERLPWTPDRVVADLTPLPSFLGDAA